jgi:hypothetical protein
MRAHRAVVATLLVLIGLLTGPRSDATPPTFPSESRDTAALMLRLSDLPSGYLVDDAGCGIGTENAPPALAQIVITYLPEACGIDFFHRRAIPEISAGALTFKTQQGASAMFADRLELVRYVTGVPQLTEQQPQSGIGDEARTFSSRDALRQGRAEDHAPGAAVVWRRGTALGFVLAAAQPGRRAERLALRLAKTQDGRMRNPTPLSSNENDDREVWLDDPRIDVPVYWLGTTFASRKGLPPLRLFESQGPPEPRSGDYVGKQAELQYEAPGSRAGGTVLELWPPRAWRRFKRTRPGRQVWGSRCARVRRVRLRSGYANVYSGYARAPRSRSCPGRPFDTFVAHAYFRRAVVAVNLCIGCLSGTPDSSDPYNSVKGMTAIVRGLRLRRPSRRR